MNHRQRIKGVLSPVLTPFKTDLSVDTDRFLRYCKWLLSQNVGLAPFGTTSEANSITVDEKIELLDAIVAAGIDPNRLMPGVGHCAIADTVRLTRHAAKLGCAGVLMLPPFYYKQVSDEGLYRAYAEIIERVGDARLRVYLYHIPPISQIPITRSLVERLLQRYPSVVVGMKDSSADWNSIKMFLDAFAKDGFDVFPGTENFLLAGMRNGAAGCISSTVNTNPAASARLYSTWREPEAEAKQQQLDRIRAIFSKYPIIAANKAAVAHYTNDEGWNTLRPPLVELTKEQSRSLIQDLDAAGFAMPGLPHGTGNSR